MTDTWATFFYASFHTKRDKARSYLLGDGVDISKLKYARLSKDETNIHKINMHT